MGARCQRRVRPSRAGNGSQPHRVRRLPAGRLCTVWVKQGHPDQRGGFPLEFVSGARHKAPGDRAESHSPRRRGREAAAPGVGTLTAERAQPLHSPCAGALGLGGGEASLRAACPWKHLPGASLPGTGDQLQPLVQLPARRRLRRPGAGARRGTRSTPSSAGLAGPHPSLRTSVGEILTFSTTSSPSLSRSDVALQPINISSSDRNSEVGQSSSISSHSDLKVTDHSGAQTDEIDNLKKELEKWKERLEKAEKQKDELLLLKLSADEKRDQAQDELRKLMHFEEEQYKESIIRKENQERNLTVVKEQNIELQREIQKLRDDLAAKSSKLSQDFRIKREIQKKTMKFTGMKNAESDDTFLNTCCLFHIAAKIPFRLQQRQALLTFEEEDVAQKLIRRGKHTVSLDNEKIELKAMPVTLETGVKFELHVTISGEKINLSEVPDLPIPDEWIRDKLELNFYKSRQGGGEVKDVRYDRKSRTAIITFLKPGVADNCMRRTKHPFCINEKRFMLSISPSIEKHLEKFQIFSGISKRTILLSEIQEVEEDEESMQDMIEIHFQKPSNDGGEIENIKYVATGTKLAYFEEDTENVA
ncbi:N-myc-interactor isoform X3 [Chelonia mydas]|uniref:N-myc-interactor isoform X3 n=1 Tax=Chelonia mydas TaxID=8469 RepID=UPI001CA8E8D6|nr:N-myc-interactor isoform X3 [Chelonia mydas]